MTSPDLSIIIPHSNNTIEKDPLLPTLLSIVDQEGINIELLIQHGGGIAGLWGKLSRPLNLSAKKENVILRVIEEKSSSPEEALAAGVKRATGNWIGFLKPGEQYLPGALMSLKSALEGDSNADVFLTGSVTTIATPSAIAPAILPTLSYLTSVQPAYPSHSFFCRTSLLRDEVSLEPQYQHQMITEWLIRLLQAGKKMVSLPIVTTAVPEKKEEKVSLLPKPTGTTLLLKPWYQWRHQAAMRSAQKSVALPKSIFIYQDSLTQRTSIS